MITSPVPDWAGRLGVLRAYLAREAFEALVISTPVNLTYLTGFAGSSGVLVCTREDAWLIIDGRYQGAARQHLAIGTMASVHLERVDRRYDFTLADLIKRLGATRLAFEADHVTVSTLAHWRESTARVDWQPTQGVVERQRLIKDAGEVAILRQAGHALAGVARCLSAWVVRGRAERDVAGDINQALGRAGFSAPAFPTIVASGPNSALPHARPTDRPLADGDLVVLDFGGVLGGYCVDLTRAAAIGQVGSSGESLYLAVRDAQAAALAAVRAGVLGSDVDRAARQVLESQGLGAAFLHGTGHGLGLEVHEAPRIARADSGAMDILDAGMVCTIEPGAYVEGLGGVRLEDDVLVTTEGCEVLIDVPRDLLVV